jgi:hypothetical protein
MSEPDNTEKGQHRQYACDAVHVDIHRRDEQIHQVGGASLEKKKPESLRVEAIRTNGDSTTPGGKFLP